MENKSLGYNLFIDRDTNDLILILLNTFRIAGEEGLLTELPEKIRMAEIFMPFAAKISKHTHELGWCNDPDCPVDNPQANDNEN
jgi:hypothetical protein